jgi:DNA gyrase subunit B
VIHLTVSRNFEAELDTLKAQMNEIQQLFSQIVSEKSTKALPLKANEADKILIEMNHAQGEMGGVFYSGHYRHNKLWYRWEPQERRLDQLLALDGDKVAKVLSALGHKQRLDILKSVILEPLTGAELVERLNMGTTGQLYHHIKALLGSDLLVQEERGGRYSLSGHRALPLLLLLAAASDLLDTSDFMEMAEARNNAGSYLGNSQDEYDPHLLLWAVLENSILEHKAGYCSEINIFLHSNGSITVADNGRGIPVHALPNKESSPAKAVFTDVSRFNTSATLIAPGGEKGINIPIVNALSHTLSVEIRRDGKVFRQDYKHGIPQTDLITVGVTIETGTSVTFMPDSEIFGSSFDYSLLNKHTEEISVAYPSLKIQAYP